MMYSKYSRYKRFPNECLSQSHSGMHPLFAKQKAVCTRILEILVLGSTSLITNGYYYITIAIISSTDPFDENFYDLIMFKQPQRSCFVFGCFHTFRARVKVSIVFV